MKQLIRDSCYRDDEDNRRAGRETGRVRRFFCGRYVPVVKCLAVLGIVFGCSMLVLDIAVGMPARWIAGEGPFIIVVGGVMFWLAGRVQLTVP